VLGYYDRLDILARCFTNPVKHFKSAKSRGRQAVSVDTEYFPELTFKNDVLYADSKPLEQIGSGGSA